MKTIDKIHDWSRRHWEGRSKLPRVIAIPALILAAFLCTALGLLIIAVILIASPLLSLFIILYLIAYGIGSAVIGNKARKQRS